MVSLERVWLYLVLCLTVATFTWHAECNSSIEADSPTLPTLLFVHQVLQPSLTDVNYTVQHSVPPPHVSCGAAAVNGLLGVDGAITDVQLLTLHLDLKLPNEAHIWYGACARVLVGVLGEHGLELRAKRDHCGATNGRDPNDTHILLNNSQHWTSMRQVNSQQWEHHDGCNVTVISPTKVDALVVASQWSSTFHKATSRQETLESKLSIPNGVGLGKTKRKRKRTEGVAACDIILVVPMQVLLISWTIY